MGVVFLVIVMSRRVAWSASGAARGRGSAGSARQAPPAPVAGPAPPCRCPRGAPCDRAVPRALLRVRGVTRRFGGVSRSAASTSRWAPASAARCWPERRGQVHPVQPDRRGGHPHLGTIELFGQDATQLDAGPHAARAVRTYQTSRLSPGSPWPTTSTSPPSAGGRHFRLLRNNRDTARRTGTRTAENVGLTDRLEALAGACPTASSASSRSASRWPPAAAAAPGRAGRRPVAGRAAALTALLLCLERDVTLLIIEHDMDIALTVADRVTVMHDGSCSSRARRPRSGPTSASTTSTWEAHV